MFQNNAENEKNVKTSTNQSTKFQQIQRKFGKPVFYEEKYNKLNESDLEVKSYNQVCLNIYSFFLFFVYFFIIGFIFLMN